MDKGFKKMLGIGLAAAMWAAALAGCGGGGQNGGADAPAAGGAGTQAAGGSQGEQVTIKFIHKLPEESRMQYFNEVIAEFEKENPNIKIEMNAYGDEEIKDKTRVLLGSDEAPDIFFTWSGQRITQYVDSGNALDITKYLEEDSQWKDSFNQSMLECCNKNGSYWAIPWDYDSKEMVYNKKIFAEAGITKLPATWDELLADCQILKDAGYTPIALGNQYSWVVCHYITTLNGKLVPEDILNANYNMEDNAFSHEGYVKALDMVRTLYDLGYVNQDVNSCTWEMSQAMVQEGKAAMVYEEVPNLVNYENSLGDDWGYFDFPEVEGGAGKAGYITGDPDVFMVNSESKHPDEAIKFLKHLTGADAQAKMVYDLGFLPVIDVELDAAQCMPEILEIIEKNMKAPGISEWLDCALNQTVADTYLIGCQTIFDDQDGAAIMLDVSATAQEVAEDQ